jgi:hypothetical protein
MFSSKRFALILLTALGLTVQAMPASAQIVVQVGPVMRPAPPPPPVVIVRPMQPPPPPRVIIVQRQPPPPPRVVYVQQPPPPQVVVQQAPVQVQPRQASGRFGIHAQVGGIGAQSVRMGGFQGGLRIRPTEHFALDIGAGVYGGQDYNGFDRVEVPFIVDALVFVNPQHRVQFYLLGGVGTSVAFRQAPDSFGPVDRLAYVGGEAGGGLEFRLTRGFALNVDGRAFMRARIDSDIPEFVDADGNTTNVSAGGSVNFGATLYF